MSAPEKEVSAKRAQGSEIRAGMRSEEGPDPSGGDRVPLSGALADRHVAGDLTLARYRKQLGDLHVAETGLRERATRVEGAAGREPEQAGDLGASQLDAQLRARDVRIGFWDRRDERRGVRVRRICDERLGVRELDHAPQVHHADATE